MTQPKAPRARRAADARPAADGFQNLSARLGVGAGSLQDASTYTLGNPITRNPRTLEAMYRSSWVVGAAVDAIADDMTREGVDFASALPPDEIEALNGAMDDLDLMGSIGDVIRWARLYGGAIGVLLIEGQDTSTPLRPETVAQGQFHGVLPLSRWELNPTGEDVGDQVGRPEFYRVGPQATALQNARVHRSRVVRIEGIRLPYYQRIAEQGWGLSIVERLFDRLLAFDSATTGAAQLVYKAYLRTMKVTGLRQILAAGGKAEETLAKQVEAIRKFQSTEGITLVDGDDEFQAHAYTFSGLDQMLLQFGQQLSGATGIPLVRLFGQSPAGLNSTGEADIRNYYDSIKALQARMLRRPLNLIFDVLYRSVTGEAPSEAFGYDFNPLWQLTEEQRATIAKTVTESVIGAYEAGVLSKPTALRELRQSADITGVFSNISDDDIAEAESEPPDLGEVAEIEDDPTGSPAAVLSLAGAPGNAFDGARREDKAADAA